MINEKTAKTDVMEYIGKTIIQHGKYNNRAYLIKLDPDANVQEILEYINRLCIKNRYSKSFLKIRASDYPPFFMDGYRIEAFIPTFFKNNDDCLFACRYYSDDRKYFDEYETGKALESLLIRSCDGRKNRKEDKEFTVRKAVESDAYNLAFFYGSQFPNYPFPVSDPAYIKKTISSDVDYFVVEDKGKLIAAASAEKDMAELNAEVTDFAVQPDYRGYGLAGKLMDVIEEHLDKSPVKTLYTIARLNSPAMNAVFKKSDYKYSGTLINNTNIVTGIESMNVWYKHIK